MHHAVYNQLLAMVEGMVMLQPRSIIQVYSCYLTGIFVKTNTYCENPRVACKDPMKHQQQNMRLTSVNELLLLFNIKTMRVERATLVIEPGTPDVI